MLIQTIKEGEKNFSVMVKGFTRDDFKRVPVIDIEKFKPPTSGWKGVRLDSIAWAIQEKMGMYLWWEDEDKESSLILPLESRNGMRYDEGVPSPRIKDGWTKRIWLSSFNTNIAPAGVKSFFILLDFDKQ
jgi:hypothetical protein